MLLFTEKGDNRVITRLGEVRSPPKDTLGIQMTSLKKADISTRGLRQNGGQRYEFGSDQHMESKHPVLRGGGSTERSPVMRQE